MICLLLILCWILISSTVFAAEENTRVAYFRTRENKRLPGYVVRSFASPSLMSCGHSCLRNSWCTSTNFKEAFKQGDKGTCELNKHEIVSINEDTQLVEQHGVTFSVFLKGCWLNDCCNGGSCLFDEKKETFSCSCKLPWTGEKCEVKITLFNFTTLGAKGRHGPDSNLRYKETGLKTVDVKDGMQEWEVPISGKYRVEACGASGGDGSSGKKGGKGAKVSGVLALTKGDKLVILVGQRGSTKSVHDPGSGGGGTFVLSSNSVPILVAGGGGGAGQKDGLDGIDKPDASGNAAGVNGSGGLVCPLSNVNMRPNDSGSGAGYAGDGGCLKGTSHCAKVTCSEGGGSKVKKFKGGEGVSGSDCDGGFGGGGACVRYPGGGGGYSGGGVAPDGVAGGGGSHKPDDTWSVIKGGCNEGDGYISFISED